MVLQSESAATRATTVYTPSRCTQGTLNRSSASSELLPRSWISTQVPTVACAKSSLIRGVVDGGATDVTTEVDGLTYRGQFRTRQNMITVEFQGRHMTNELTGSAATAEVFLARAMLSKLVRAAHGH